MSFIDSKIALTCQTLWELAHKKIGTPAVAYVKTDGYKTDNTFPESGWQPLEPGMRLSGSDEHYWLKTTFSTPPAKPGISYHLKVTTGFEGQWDATNPQGLAYLNGKMVQGLDTNHTDVWLQPDTDYVFHNYFYIGLIDAGVPVTMALYACNERIEQLYYDMKVALDVCRLHHKNSDEYVSLMGVLEQAANLLDLRDPAHPAFTDSVEEAIAFLDRELYENLCTTDGKPIVDCIGHTHIDVEWLWDRKQTREKIQRSFCTASALMRQYPFYKFMLSQPELYRYLKEEAPEAYEQLKEYVKSGRFEPEGAMYVEADCNLISGESMIRQILQGKRFFQDEFGVDCKILFLPDVFGYSAALPQILNKCGIRYFVTSKISWNETNTMPVDCFLWEGLDGSEIFTNFITTQDYTGPEPQRFSTYTGLLTPSQIKGTWNKFIQKEYADRAMTTYGYGDGGGGPTKTMLETGKRLAKGFPGMPVVRFSTLREHLDQKRKEFDAGCRKTKRTPKWVGELYLELHRGTYTSIAKNKRNNRLAEFALQKAEALSYLGLLHGQPYDAAGLYENWNKVLHNQFHDIIPGSSIKRVYDGTDRDYAAIRAFTDRTIAQALRGLYEKAACEKGVFVYNPSGFARKGSVLLNGQTVEIGEEIPAYGYKTVKAVTRDCAVRLKGLTAENLYYRLTLDPAGRITSLYDKTAGRDVLKPGEKGNEWQAFEDYPKQHDNWEITDYYKEKMWVLDDTATVTPVTDGSRAGFEIRRLYMHSAIVQTIWLYSESRRIDFETELDWHESHQLIKVAFPLDVHTHTAVYETQFGHISRPTHQNSSWDQAKFEVCGHKWAVLQDRSYGIALLNDCKYGFSCQDSTLKLTVLKCGTYPNPEADQGSHRFVYSLLPFSGDFCRAGVIREAYALNQPMDAIPTEGHAGTLAAVYAPIRCDRENIVLETVKKAEADDSMVVRLYDSFDCRTDVTLTVADSFQRVFLCDMLENEQTELAFDGHRVTLPVSNFEIVTLKFKR